MLLRPLDERGVVRGRNSNLHAITLSVDHGRMTNLPTMWPQQASRFCRNLV